MFDYVESLIYFNSKGERWQTRHRFGQVLALIDSSEFCKENYSRSFIQLLISFQTDTDVKV